MDNRASELVTEKDSHLPVAIDLILLVHLFDRMLDCMGQLVTSDFMFLEFIKEILKFVLKWRLFSEGNKLLEFAFNQFKCGIEAYFRKIKKICLKSLEYLEQISVLKNAIQRKKTPFRFEFGDRLKKESFVFQTSCCVGNPSIWRNINSALTYP